VFSVLSSAYYEQTTYSRMNNTAQLTFRTWLTSLNPYSFEKDLRSYFSHIIFISLIHTLINSLGTCKSCSLDFHMLFHKISWKSNQSYNWARKTKMIMLSTLLDTSKSFSNFNIESELEGKRKKEMSQNVSASDKLVQKMGRRQTVQNEALI